MIGFSRCACAECRYRERKLHSLPSLVQDGTLVTTKSGSQFAQSEHDWVPFNQKVYPTLQRLHASGYKIVLFRRASP